MSIWDSQILTWNTDSEFIMTMSAKGYDNHWYVEMEIFEGIEVDLSQNGISTSFLLVALFEIWLSCILIRPQFDVMNSGS